MTKFWPIINCEATDALHSCSVHWSMYTHTYTDTQTHTHTKFFETMILHHYFIFPIYFCVSFLMISSVLPCLEFIPFLFITALFHLQVLIICCLVFPACFSFMIFSFFKYKIWSCIWYFSLAYYQIFVLFCFVFVFLGFFWIAGWILVSMSVLTQPYQEPFGQPLTGPRNS